MNTKYLTEKLTAVVSVLNGTALRVDQHEAAGRLQACVYELDRLVKMLEAQEVKTDEQHDCDPSE